MKRKHTSSNQGNEPIASIQQELKMLGYTTSWEHPGYLSLIPPHSTLEWAVGTVDGVWAGHLAHGENAGDFTTDIPADCRDAILIARTIHFKLEKHLQQMDRSVNWFNIADEVYFEAMKYKDLFGIATGGGCDFIAKRLEPHNLELDMTLSCADDGSSPDTLEDASDVNIWFNHDGDSCAIIKFKTAREAIQFMAEHDVTLLNTVPEEP